LLQIWEDGWSRVFRALEPLSDSDLGRTVTIRGEAHSVMQAISRQMAHYANQCGADRPAGEAFRPQAVATANRTAQPVDGVQSEGRGGECQPAIREHR
jgi:hypothetical protein